MYQDFRDLLAAFNAHRVKYLIVGGYAVSLHAQPRTTKDLDLFLEPQPANGKAVFNALADFGAPISDFKPEDFSDAKCFIRFGREPQAVDLMSEIEGIDFDSAWHRRVEVVLDQSSGLIANFLSREDLIASKLASGRLRDLADVEELRQQEAPAPDAD
jgi:hypothetical protein